MTDPGSRTTCVRSCGRRCRESVRGAGHWVWGHDVRYGVKSDHSACMVLACQFGDGYRKSVLGVASQQALAGECLARASPTLVSTCCSVWPGFAPAGEAPSTWLRTGLLFRQKASKPVTPRLASWEGRDAGLRRAGQLAESILSHVEGLTHGPPAEESVPPVGQTAGVEPWKTNLSGTYMTERGTLYSV